MAYKACENCGCHIYEYGCVNCNEEAYIEAQQLEIEQELRETNNPQPAPAQNESE